MNNPYSDTKMIILLLDVEAEDFGLDTEAELFDFIKNLQLEAMNLINEYCERDFSQEPYIPAGIPNIERLLVINTLNSIILSRQTRITNNFEDSRFSGVITFSDDIKELLAVYRINKGVYFSIIERD